MTNSSNATASSNAEASSNTTASSNVKVDNPDNKQLLGVTVNAISAVIPN